MEARRAAQRQKATAQAMAHAQRVKDFNAPRTFGPTNANSVRRWCVRSSTTPVSMKVAREELNQTIAMME
jgi:hypothetical protein